MLSSSLSGSVLSSFIRNAVRVDKASVHNLIGQGSNWVCFSKSGKANVMSSEGAAIKAGEYVLMALGCCAGSDIKASLDELGKNCRWLGADIDADLESNPNRISNINVKFHVDSDASPADLNKIIKKVEKSMCPIINTLRVKPKFVYSVNVKN